MGNSKEDPPANASKSSAGQDDEQPRVTRMWVTSVYPNRPTYQNYTPVPPTSSIIPSALHNPYDWRPEVPYIIQATSAYPDQPIYQDAVPESIPDIWDGESKTSEDTEIPEESLASGIELRTERGYSGYEASCEGSDVDYQYVNMGSPSKARDHQSSSDDTPQKGNPTRVNETSQPVPGYPMTTGAILALPVPGGLTGCTTNLSPILPTCSEITSTEVPTTSVSVPSGTWMQDMQELKRQRKLEAGRESDRRVKLTEEVAELDRLTRRADVLIKENASLRAEIRRLREENKLFLALNASMKVNLEKIPRETEADQQQNPDSNVKRADDQQQNPDSNEKRADDQQQNPDSNEKRTDDQQQNPDSNEKRADDQLQNPDSNEK